MRTLDCSELDQVSGGYVYSGFSVTEKVYTTKVVPGLKLLFVALPDRTVTTSSLGEATTEAQTEFSSAIEWLMGSATGKTMLNALSDNDITVQMDDKLVGEYSNPSERTVTSLAAGVTVPAETVFWNPTIKASTSDGEYLSPAICLAHELAHQYLEEYVNMHLNDDRSIADKNDAALQAAYKIIDLYRGNNSEDTGNLPADKADEIGFNNQTADPRGVMVALHEQFSWAIETAIATELGAGTRESYSETSSSSLQPTDYIVPIDVNTGLAKPTVAAA
jgi:hypothetical protein